MELVDDRTWHCLGPFIPPWSYRPILSYVNPASRTTRGVYIFLASIMTGLFMRTLISSRSKSRNSFHSVKTTSTSQSSAVSYGDFVKTVSSGRTFRACSSATGSYTLTHAPSSINRGMISTDGASRISSVFGLKARPRIPIVLFFTSPPAHRWIFSMIRARCSLLT
mgnify:CR=1 FL=1